MIEKRISEDFGGSYARFAEHIRHRLDTEWAAEARSDWIACDRHPRGLALHSTRAQVAFAGSVEETQVFASRACADLWAAQINRLDCSSVWQGIHDGVELSGEYYRANIQLIEKLIAMGGVRLAAVLNGYQY